MLPHVTESEKDLDDPDVIYPFENPKKIKWYHRILLNRPLKVTLAFTLMAIAAPLLMYRFYFFKSMNLLPPDGFSIGSCLTPREIRLPCGIGQMPQDECPLQQCCFDRNLSICYHRIPSRFSYIITESWNENVILKPRIATVPFSNQKSIVELRLSINEVSTTHMSITFYNSTNTSLSGDRLDKTNYTYEVAHPEVSIVVNASQGTVFNTARGPLIASDNIWEISFKLTDESMYGLGELPLKGNTTKVIYSHDGGITAIPLIFAKINTSFHGLLIDVSEPTEIIIRTDNQIIVRSITNFGLKFHLFVGPEPKGIMEDVMKVTGRYKQLQYWMLGIHVCSEIPGLDLGNFISNATSGQMPFDSHCGHGPIVFKTDQCNITNINMVNSGATIVRDAGKMFVPHVSPYIHYLVNETLIEDDEAEGRIDTERCKIIPTYENIMYRRPNTLELYKGEVDDFKTIYPSYDQVSEEFMTDLWAYDKYDGIVLENNWPLDTSEKLFNETVLYLPYFSESFENAFESTPNWNLTLVNDSQLYLFKHNTYGNKFAQAFAEKDNSAPIWSSSVWMNGSLAINRQNINTSWTNLHRELIAAALGGISGHWLWSTPICGDTENFNLTTQSNLCVKWYMAATYLPMIKIHSRTFLRHPTAFSGTPRALIIQALNRRLGLLPYFYTTLQEGPLLRPMFYQFPLSSAIHNIDSQFSVGESLLIAPNLTPMQTHVHVWFPNGTWYELWSGLKINGNESEPITMATTEADFLTFIRGGSILIYQKTSNQTAEVTRLTPFTVIIALKCSEGNESACQASGKQFITENMKLYFVATNTTMTITAEGSDYDAFCDNEAPVWTYKFESISIYGLNEEHNNFDNQKRLIPTVDLCNLKQDDKMVIDL